MPSSGVTKRLLHAIEAGDLKKTAKVSAERGCDVNRAMQLLNYSFAVTPLYVAAGLGHTAIAAMLLRARADPERCVGEGITPLYVASEYGHTAVVELLVDEGGVDCEKATPDDAKFLLVDWGPNPPPEDGSSTGISCTDCMRISISSSP